ncbi:MAG: TonB-dependent receptor [Calditrichaeota bacterium]|nr:TonB-dependent receptor [Calditrichota bacterium]
MKPLLKAFFLMTVFFLGLPLGAVTQTGQIEGRITDAQSGQPLQDVNITLLGTRFGAATSEDGYFLIEEVPAGEYTIVFERIGYQKVSRKIVVSPKKVTNLVLSLSVEPIGLDEIVVEREHLIGSPERLFNIPGSAHYLGLRELSKHEYNDINRALREIPGINIQEEDGYGLRPNIGLRGTGVERSQKITLMEDGVLIAPAPYSAPAAYYFPTIGRMEGIEVRKGSSQIKYGPFTTGGALNLISTSIPSEFKVSIKLLAGEDNARRIHAFAGNSFKNVGFLVETFQARVDGFKELDGGGNTGFDKKDYMVKLRLNTSLNARVYQEVTFKLKQTDEVSNETYLGLTEADFKINPLRRYAASQKDVMNSKHLQFQVRHFAKLSSAIDITTTLYRNDFKRNWYKLDAVRASEAGEKIKISKVLEDPVKYAGEYAIITGQTSANDNALVVKANNRKYYAQGIQSIVGMQFNIGGKRHEAELGFRYHEDEMDRFQWVDDYKMDNGVMRLTRAGTPGTESNRISRARVWAGFVQFNLSFGKLVALPGLRYENITLTREDFGKSDPQRTGVNVKRQKNQVDVWIPGIGLDYKFSPFFSTFLGIHKGFAPPGSRENTKPEESMNYEFGLRYHTDVLSLQSVVFFNDYTNLLGADLFATGGEGTGDLFNGGEAEVKGLEVSFSFDFGSQMGWPDYAIPLRMAYTFTDATFQNSFKSDYKPWGTVEKGDELPYLPRHQFYTSLGLETATYRIHISAKYVGRMRTVAGKGDFVESRSTDAHTVFDLSAEYAITPSNRVFLSVRNLTNAIYVAARRPAGLRPGLPRTFLAGVKTHF